MRKYQKREVEKLRNLYQSNHPLKWVYSANLLGISRPMTDRERRIFFKRFKDIWKNVASGVGKMFNSFAKIMANVAGSIAQIATAYKFDPDKFQSLPLANRALLQNMSVGIDTAKLGADQSLLAIHGKTADTIIIDDFMETE